MQTWEALELLRCQDCGRRRQVVHDAKQFARLPEQARCSSPPTPSDKRPKEDRYLAMETAVITRRCPPDLGAIEGTVVDISKSGLRIQSPVGLADGAEILIRVDRTAIFGTVRYCGSHGEIFFDIGLTVVKVVIDKDTNAAMNVLRNELDGNPESTLAQLTTHDESAGEPPPPRATSIPVVW